MQRKHSLYANFGSRKNTSLGAGMKSNRRMLISQASTSAVAGLLLAAPNVRAQYTFTNVADTTTAAPSGNFAYFDPPSISGGNAAFQGYYNGSSGIFTGSGGGLTTIATEGQAAPAPMGPFTSLTDPSISNGTVAFAATDANSNVGIFTGNGGALATVEENGTPSPDGGTFNTPFAFQPAISGANVAFTAFTTVGLGVFARIGGTFATICEAGSTPAPFGLFDGFEGTPSISGGVVAFEAEYQTLDSQQSGNGVFTGSGGPLTTIAKSGDPAPTGTFNIVGSPVISGTAVAFYGTFNGGTQDGIFIGSGGALTTIVQSGQAAPIGTFDLYGVSGLSFDGNTVAFEDSYGDNAGQGIFTGTGGALTPVIKTGDSLFGSTVDYLGFGQSALDDDHSGDIAFAYGLADGVYGVAIAAGGAQGQGQTLTWNDAGYAAQSDGRTWDIGFNYNWNNGTANTVYSDGSNVVFNDDNNSNLMNGGYNLVAYDVTLNTTVSPSSVTVSNSSGNYSITGSGKIIDTGSFTKSGTDNLTLGTGLTAAGFSIDQGNVIIAANTTQGVAIPLLVSSNVNLSSLTIKSNAYLDITNNHIIIDYTSSDPIATIYGYLKSGFNSGGWNGTTGIISSTAQTLTNGLRYGIGWADGADKVVPGLLSGEIELKYTLLGDANLDGTVNGSDFSILAANFGLGVTNWDQGNFLYGSSVNGSDFSALAANFGQGDSGAAVAVSPADIAALDAFAVANGLPLPAISSVPEPAFGAIVLINICLALPRRRRGFKARAS
jgi:hypothetical protein